MFFSLLILSLLVYSAFGGQIPFSGNVISGSVVSEGIPFSAELNIPSLELKGDFRYVQFFGNADSSLQIGDSEFEVDDKINRVILNNYSGKIYFDDTEVSEIDGKTRSASVNGVLVSNPSDKKVGVSSNSFEYSFLKVQDSVFIKKLEYNASGFVSLNNGKNIFKFDDGILSLENFVGDIVVSSNKISFDGFVKRFEVLGDEKIVVE
jgi:hypothetical protein